VNKDIKVLDFLTESEITKIVNKLKESKLTEKGQGYHKYGKSLISLAANKSAKNYTMNSKSAPAIALIEVVLSANRNYNLIVVPRISSVRLNYPQLKKFNELKKLIKTKSKKDFYDIWNYRDEKKYNTLKSIMDVISNLRVKYPLTSTDDYKLMNAWAKNVDLAKIKEDEIGSISNVGIATIQHLRMTFGVNTIKPDLRVKQVLENEFKLKYLSDIKVISAVEQIASIVKLSVIECDQIFVMFGSSYYNNNKGRNKSSNDNC
jgi:hypothetical protein